MARRQAGRMRCSRAAALSFDASSVTFGDSFSSRRSLSQDIFSLAGLEVSPNRAHVTQMLDDFRNHLQDVVHLFVGVVIAQAQTQGAVGHIMDTADGQQHMAGIQTTGGAGRTGRSGNTLEVQQVKRLPMTFLASYFLFSPPFSP